MHIVRKFLFAILCVYFASFAVKAQVVVGDGASISLNGGDWNNACLDFTLGDATHSTPALLEWSLGGVLHTVADFTISASGVLQGADGIGRIHGNWSNSGQFVSGTSRVELSDGCLRNSSQILGSSPFFNLSLDSSLGKTFVLQAGTTQTIASRLSIRGEGAPVQIVSSADLPQAQIHLSIGGEQSISNVAVNNAAATGQHLAPSLTNQRPDGIAPGWFRLPELPVPLGGLVSFVLALALGVLGMRRRSTKPIGRTQSETSS